MLHADDPFDPTVKLPQHAQSLPEADAEPSPRQPRDGGKHAKIRRVLVVDDCREVRDFECQLLSRRGYHVEVATDGVDAWHMLCEGDFDLVLTDIDMPLFDGIRLIRKLRREPRFQTLPVLVVCEDDRDAQRRPALEAGADFYVMKDRFQDTLPQTVASLIGPGRS
jgi:two-component system sensor histidine kinase and response regulator WspE